MSKLEALTAATFIVLSILLVTPFAIITFTILINLKSIVWLFISLVLLSILILWIGIYKYNKDEQ